MNVDDSIAHSGTEIERDLLRMSSVDTIPVMTAQKPGLARQFVETPLWKIVVPIGLIGLLLVFLGGIEWVWLSDIRHWLGWSLLGEIPRLVGATGEALVVAALLGGMVDSFLKERLLREISTNVFEHMLGFDQQPEIKERLREIVTETKLYRRNGEVHWTMGEEQDGLIPVDLSIAYDVINPTPKEIPFSPGFACKTSEHPTDQCEVVIVCNDAAPKSMKVPFEHKDGEAVAKTAEVSIKPASHGVTYRFTVKTGLQLPLNYYHPLFFAHPTIGVTVFVQAPKGLNVVVSSTGGGDGGVWHAPGLFMQGHPGLEIRWQQNPAIPPDRKRGLSDSIPSRA